MNILRRMSVVNVQGPRQVKPIEVVDKDSDLVNKAINCISSVGLGCDLFIKAAAPSELKPFKKKVDAGQVPDFINPYIAADILLHYFSKQPDSLLTHIAYPRFLRVIQIPSNNQRINQIDGIMRSLPRKNRELCVVLFGVLSNLAGNPYNSVNAHGIAEKITPTVMRLPPKVSKTDKELAVDVIRFLISNYKDIFEEFDIDEVEEEDGHVLKKIQSIDESGGSSENRRSLRPALTEYFQRSAVPPSQEGKKSLSRAGTNPSLPQMDGSPAQKYPQAAMKSLMDSFMDDDYDTPLEDRDDSNTESDVMDEDSHSDGDGFALDKEYGVLEEEGDAHSTISSQSASSERMVGYIPTSMTNLNESARKRTAEGTGTGNSLYQMKVTPSSSSNIKGFMLDDTIYEGEDRKYEFSDGSVSSYDGESPSKQNFRTMESADVKSDESGDEVLPILDSANKVQPNLPEVQINPEMMAQMEGFKFGGNDESESSDDGSTISSSSMEEIDTSASVPRPAHIPPEADMYRRMPTDAYSARDMATLNERAQMREKGHDYSHDITEEAGAGVDASVVFEMKAKIAALTKENEILLKKSSENTAMMVRESTSPGNEQQVRSDVQKKLEMVLEERDDANKKAAELQRKLDEANKRVAYLEDELCVASEMNQLEIEKMREFLLKFVKSPLFTKSRKKHSGYTPKSTPRSSSRPNH